nr:helix-turn-helix domain-containing protein [Streptomyces sp. NBC_00857]
MATTEAEAFARLLRELKGRSGQSYGVLAGKLHVSTSTLHRYCNGDAVPAEFAPVERLARLCGAKGEELVALHRRWILADEARRRARSAAPPAAEATSAADTDPVADAAPIAETTPAADTTLGADTTPAAAPTTAGSAEGPDPDGAEAGQGDSSAPDPSTDVTVTGKVDLRAPGTRPGRKGLVFAAAALVAAVAVSGATVGAWGALTDGDASVSAKDVGDGAQGEGPADLVSPSPTPSRSGKSPSASASASPSGGAGPSGPAAGNKSPSAGRTSGGENAQSGAVPVTAVTRPYAFADPCGPNYLVDSPPKVVPPPPSEQDAPGWIGALGGVPAEEQLIELTLQGTSSETVVLQALRVRTVKRSAPLAWNVYGGYSACGGEVSTKSFDVDLNSGHPVTVPKAGQRDFPYKVSESDPEVFYITANVSAYDVSWYLEVEWSSGDRHGTLRVDNNGKPFRTSGAQGRPSYYYMVGGTEWETDGTFGDASSDSP